MTLDEIDAYCQSLPVCTVRYPFESSPHIRAWCIGKKMFAWANITQHPTSVQLKANPALIPSLIESYSCVQPGYHMNKRHWVTVDAESCESSMLMGLLEDAHTLVTQGLAKVERIRLLGD